MHLKNKEILLSIIIVLTLFGSFWFRPALINRTADNSFDLNNIPSNFGGWTLDIQGEGQVINAEVSSELEKVYSQTLSKIYVNNKTGYKVMLSIAYGKEQSQSLQIHRPEVCYAAQGFSIFNQTKKNINILGSDVPVMQMNALLGVRDEPITYWIRIGDRLVRGNIEQGLARVWYGLNREIPDGVLFRVSSIDSNYQNAFTIQNEFIGSLISSVSIKQREMLLGSDWTTENLKKK